ncbi:MAG: transposase [Gemmatimonadaceae bacterium]
MTRSTVGAAARRPASPMPATAHTLSWLARTFELAQSERVRRGERIRAIAQARDLSWDVPQGDIDADSLLSSIEREQTLGPVPFLGMLYQHAWAEERELSQLLEEAVTQHPAWPWLMQIRGVGPRLAARLLGRLRIELARSPSAFWSYCGLATVQAVEYRCATCGARTVAATRGAPPGRHLVGAERRQCAGRFAPMIGSSRRRMAEPKPRRLDARRYDASAKTICFLVGTSFSRQGGPYKAYYKDAYQRYSCRHPDWPAKRRVLAAMRLTVKLFLKHLWIVWREAEGLSPNVADGPSPVIDGTPGPWEMVSPPSVEKLRAADRLAQKLGTRVVRRGRPPKSA